MATSRLTLVTSKPIAPVRRPSGRRIFASLWPVAALYVIYTAVRWLVADRGPKVGGEHAQSLLALERKLSLDWELDSRSDPAPRVARSISEQLLRLWFLAGARRLHHRWRGGACRVRLVANRLPVSLMLALVGFAAFH